MKPLIPLTDKRFVYVNAASTDVAKTFAKAREAMQQRSATDKPKASVRALRTSR